MPASATDSALRTTLAGRFRAGLLGIAIQACAVSPSAADLLAHDPSRIVAAGGRYHVFSTGRGCRSATSANLTNWVAGPPVFGRPPAWTTNAVPANKGDFWAPDVIELEGRLLLYYSVSTWGKNTSAIGLAIAEIGERTSTNLVWEDQGVVIQSAPADDFNAIDPAPVLDADGRLWLTFGSFWSGIKLVELDRKTGQRLASGTPVHSLASGEKIEAPYLHQRGGWYHLFVNWGQCCRGTNSTYNVRVGRSRAITGLYRDRDGKDLREGGGSLVLETEGRFIGPGHVGIANLAGQEWITFHFYDRDRAGKGTLARRRLWWDAAGWPVVEPPPADAEPDPATDG